MKKFTLLSLVAVSILFTACDQKTEKATEEKAEVVKETVEKKTTTALEDAKSAFNKASEATKVKAAELANTAKAEAEAMAAQASDKATELKDSATKSLNEASDVIKEKSEAVKIAATEALATIIAPAAYAKCKGCHGAEGKTKALGKSAIIAGQDKAALIVSLNAYKAGTKNEVGMGGLMKSQVATMSDTDFEAIAEYLSAIK